MKRGRKGIDETGNVYGMLTVEERDLTTPHPSYYGYQFWARCQCGNRVSVRGGTLRSGMTRTCGQHADTTRDTVVTNRPEYGPWSAMMRRCYTPTNHDYPRYGGKGVRVCPKWHTYGGFLEDMKGRPPGTSLDRYPDHTGNYEPGNVRWATVTEQNNNKRTNWVHRIKEAERMAA